MKVKELIENLQKVNPENEIYLFQAYSEGGSVCVVTYGEKPEEEFSGFVQPYILRKNQVKNNENSSEASNN